MVPKHSFLYGLCLNKQDDKCVVTVRPYFHLTCKCALEKVNYEKYGMSHYRQREGFLNFLKLLSTVYERKFLAEKGPYSNSCQGMNTF